MNNKVIPENILVIEAKQNYTQVAGVDMPVFTVYATLKSWLGVVPPNDFVMIHRAYIVNLRHVVKFDNLSVFLTDGRTIPIGNVFRKNLLEKVKIFGVNRNAIGTGEGENSTVLAERFA